MAEQVPTALTTNETVSVPALVRNIDEEREAISKAKAANARAVQNSRESAWFLKVITFGGQQKKIITQNYNGCVLIHRF